MYYSNKKFFLAKVIGVNNCSRASAHVIFFWCVIKHVIQADEILGYERPYTIKLLSEKKDEVLSRDPHFIRSGVIRILRTVLLCIHAQRIQIRSDFCGSLCITETCIYFLHVTLY